ncbi:LpqB family beta-propeller domain-containing protein [Dactylosporangium sp. NPDC005572]|uniref:LpqB family beta-propeller domain-containing protein n=1 Tax=Dactylosporangium sp. NPDC005572 TaxID=3156889 RepID=UPI0033B545C1
MTPPRPGRRWLGALLAVWALLGTMLVAGCGLPGETEPKYLEPAATANPTPDRVQQPPSPTGAATASELVARFLEASVGGNQADSAEARNTTQNRMREFIAPDTRASWRPGQELEVVRAEYEAQEPVTDPKDSGKWTVKTTFEVIGKLTPTGMLRQVDAPPEPWTAEVVTVNGQLLIANPLQGRLLISSAGLDRWYNQQPVYFWESRNDNPKLVPDLRYMSKLLSQAQKVQEVLDWLRSPSDLLTPVATGLSTDIEPKDIPSARQDGVVINLSIKAVGKEDEVRRAARQIRWSLEGHPQVTLTIDGARDTAFTADGFEDDNPAVALAADTDPEKFVVANSSVRPVDLTAGAPALFAAGGDNTAVVSAAINRARNRAALVRAVDKKQVLYLSTPDTSANPPKYVTSVPEVSGASLTRPVWVDRPTPMFLVSDGTDLWAVTPPTAADPTHAKAETVRGPQGPERPSLGITALAVSPEGRRIAFVTGSTVKVAPLAYEGGKVSLGTFRTVRTSLGAAQSVGWITETTLAVGGSRNPYVQVVQAYSLVSITIDGTAEQPLPGRAPYATAQNVITEMSVRTADPRSQAGAGLIMFESNGIAYTVYNEGIRAIQLTPGPQPSASPSGQAGPPPQAKAPFYPD